MKIKTFINIKRQLDKVKNKVNWWHEQFKQPVKGSEVPMEETPYQIVFHWFLDIVSYGFIITFIWNAWFGWQGWINIALVFANGFALWMVKEVIKTVKEGMKEQ